MTASDDILFPPWEQFPGAGTDLAAWDDAHVQQHDDRFQTWFAGLNPYEQAAVSCAFPEPAAWAGYYKRIAPSRH